jgi:hypothetical protein
MTSLILLVQFAALFTAGLLVLICVLACEKRNHRSASVQPKKLRLAAPRQGAVAMPQGAASWKRRTWGLA